MSADPNLFMVRHLAGVVGLLTAAWGAGCTSARNSGEVTRSESGGGSAKLAPSANVSRMEAWRDAEALAARVPGGVSAVGSGESMAPVFGDNTLLVLAPLAFEELAAGMTIAYRNSQGFQVVHQLRERTRHGWTVQGLNNEVADRECVTRENFLGVVYASLASNGVRGAHVP